MARFKVAHIREQGVDLIVIPLDDTFGYKQSAEQRNIIAELQGRASSAGLAGTVVPVWNSGGRMAFIARRPWHPFFQNISLAFVLSNLNREIYWS